VSLAQLARRAQPAQSVRQGQRDRQAPLALPEARVALEAQVQPERLEPLDLKERLVLLEQRDQRVPRESLAGQAAQEELVPLVLLEPPAQQARASPELQVPPDPLAQPEQVSLA
jgi:hypothetical protein